MIWLLLSSALAGRPAILDTLLEEPWTTLEQSSVPRGLQMVVLSNLADGCARRGDAQCVSQVVEIALDERLKSTGTLSTAHLTIILGAEKAVGLDAHATLHARLARELYDRSMRDPWHNPPSYAGDPSRWPADQAATLYAIHRYDPHLAATAFASWISIVHHRGTHPMYGLPASELTGSQTYSTLPRGCALMWTVSYLAEVDPTYAAKLWQDSLVHMWVVTPLGPAMREYPYGQERAADWDSGPIVMGIGTAASAFAVGAAHAVGDHERSSALVTAESEVRAMVEASGPASVQDLTSGILAESIRYRWFATSELD